MKNKQDQVTTTVIPTLLMALIFNILCILLVFGLLVFNLSNPVWDTRARLIASGIGIITLIPAVFLFIVIRKRIRMHRNRKDQDFR